MLDHIAVPFGENCKNRAAKQRKAQRNGKCRSIPHPYGVFSGPLRTLRRFHSQALTGQDRSR